MKSVTLGDSDSEYDKPFLAQVNTEKFLGQFESKSLPITDVDIVSGATISSKAVIEAVNSLAPTNEIAIQTLRARGLSGLFDVNVALEENCLVKSVTLGDSDSEYDKPFLAQVNTEKFLGQFKSKSLPITDVDIVSGATISSKAVIEAVNNLATDR